MSRRNPVSWLLNCADWFEQRGVYVPGEDSRTIRPMRDFGWLIVVWLIGVSFFVLFFAFAV